jgi:radical SAM superfamily enzyme YgiQ (UPF0313 family)
MNILFIKATGVTNYNVTVTQPLGLMYLASFLREKSPDKHNLKLVDMRLYGNSLNKVEKIIKEFSPDVVALSAVTMEAHSMHDVAKKVKEEFPECKIVTGGPHPTAFIQKTLDDSNIDVAVIGEGEMTFTALVEAYNKGDGIGHVNGIAFMRDGQLIRTENREYIKDLDSIPFPAWDLIEFDEYKNYLTNTPLGFRNDMMLFTSRACPYNCIYCHRIFGKVFRARSAENVLEEIDILYNKYGIRDFDLVDDCFNLDAKRAEKICDSIIEKGYKVHLSFPNGLRTDRLEKGLLEKLAKAGTVFISFAIETATPRLQKLIKKNLNIEKVKSAIDHAAKLGILTNGFLMLGFPTETEDEIRSTVDYALTSNLHQAAFLIVTPFEGTELFELYAKDRNISNIDFNDYSYHKSSFNLSEISDSRLSEIQRRAYLKFYFSPKRIFRILHTYTMLGHLSCLFFLFKYTLKMAVKKGT